MPKDTSVSSVVYGPAKRLPYALAGANKLMRLRYKTSRCSELRQTDPWFSKIRGTTEYMSMKVQIHHMHCLDSRSQH